MQSKLGLDFGKVAQARGAAANIARQVQDFVDGYTTVATERTLVRLLGVDGITPDEVPYPNVVVDALKDANLLGEGVIFVLGNAVVETGKTPQQIAEDIASGKIDVSKIAVAPEEKRAAALRPYIDASMKRIRDRRARREEYLRTIGEGPKP